MTLSFTTIGESIVAALPPAFLALCMINVVFIGGVFWYEQHQNALRAQLINKLLDTCALTLQQRVQ